MTNHVRRILDELTAQNAPTAPAQGAETAAQGNTPLTAKTTHIAREDGAGGSQNGDEAQGQRARAPTLADDVLCLSAQKDGGTTRRKEDRP